MAIVKAAALTVGLAGAYALGVWTAPEIRNILNYRGPAPRAAGVTTPAAPASPSAPAPRPASTARDTASTRTRAALTASAETVRDYVKPLLNKGTNMALAAAGFRDAEQFMTLAHAARDTKIPFVVLKHRVLSEGKSLVAAIREANVGVNAAQAAARARADAKAALSRLLD